MLLWSFTGHHFWLSQIPMIPICTAYWTGSSCLNQSRSMARTGRMWTTSSSILIFGGWTLSIWKFCKYNSYILSWSNSTETRKNKNRRQDLVLYLSSFMHFIKQARIIWWRINRIRWDCKTRSLRKSSSNLVQLGERKRESKSNPSFLHEHVASSHQVPNYSQPCFLCYNIYLYIKLLFI